MSDTLLRQIKKWNNAYSKYGFEIINDKTVLDDLFLQCYYNWYYS